MVVLMSGTPIDNKWTDLLSIFAMISGHPIRALKHMYSAFTRPDEQGGDGQPIRDYNKLPEGHYITRLVQLIVSFTLRRTKNIPGLPQPIHRLVKIHLNENEEGYSNSHFRKYMKAAGMAGGKVKVSLKTGRVKSSFPWKDLTLATQHAYHPALAEIMSFERSLDKTKRHSDGVEEDAILTDPGQVTMWNKWRENLKGGRKWASTRILAILSEITRRRALLPRDTAALIFDESVFALDIVDIALCNMDDPIIPFRFDGRCSPIERADTLERFSKAASPKVMLLSRGTGSVGLNITAANLVIRCSPSWKKTWEDQADSRALRPGQTRTVTIVEIIAVNAEVEQYKMSRRNGKNPLNESILRQCTKNDDEQPKRCKVIE